MARTECFELIERLPEDLERKMTLSHKARVLVETNTRTHLWLIGVSTFVFGLSGILAVVLIPLTLISSHALVWSLAAASVGVTLLAMFMLVGFLASRGCWFIPSRFWLQGEVHSAPFVWSDSRIPLLLALRSRILAWNEGVAQLNELVATQNMGVELSEDERKQLQRAEQEHTAIKEKIELLDYLGSLADLGEFREPIPVTESPRKKPTEFVVFFPAEFGEALRAAKEN